MKTRLILALAALCVGNSLACAQEDRGEVAKKMASFFGYKRIPAVPAFFISPDGKTCVDGDMFFYDIKEALSAPAAEKLPDFGLVVAVDSGKKNPEWAREDLVHQRLIEKLEALGKAGVSEDGGELEMDELKKKYVTTAEEKAAFDGWVKEFTAAAAQETQTVPLVDPGFNVIGWTDHQSAAFYREKDERAGSLIVVVNTATKVGTLYILPENTPKQANVKFVLWQGRVFPGVKLIVSPAALPPEVQQLLDASLERNQRR